MILKRYFLSGITLIMIMSLIIVDVAAAALADTTVPVPNLRITETAAVATDPAGNLYVADTKNNKIIMISTTDVITDLNISIPLSSPEGIAVDNNGSLYIADTGNYRILFIAANPATKLVDISIPITPIIIAGNGTSAILNRPTGIAVDSTSTIDKTGSYIETTGYVYVADNLNYLIKKINKAKFDGKGGVTLGTVTTIAGNGNATTLTPFGIALSAKGDLYIADTGNNRILKMVGAKAIPVTVAGTGTIGYSGDGGLATNAQLNQPSGVAMFGDDLYIADTMNNSVRKVLFYDGVGIISTRFGSASETAGVVAPVGFERPVSIAFDSAGKLFVEDSGNGLIHQVYPSISSITTSNPPGGTYIGAQSVKLLTTNKSANIIYDLNDGIGYRPYMSDPINIASNTIIKFKSTDAAGNIEVENIASYIIKLAPVSGVCGGSNGKSFSVVPEVDLCKTGTASTVTGTNSWNWSCDGSNEGTNATCTAKMIATNGTCGASSGKSFTEVPAVDLCKTGTASEIIGTGPWSWSCAGLNAGTTANCTAKINPANGVCGASNGKNFTIMPTVDLCSTGTETAVTGTGPWSWSCDGFFSGKSANCNALVVSGYITSGGLPELKDALLVLQSAVGTLKLNSEELQRADFDGNGKVDVGDAILILAKVVGL